MVDAIQSVCAALGAANAKVQWNACYAAGQLLRNESVTAIHAPIEQLRCLVVGLLSTLATSENFKSRTQAAAALAALPDFVMDRAQRRAIIAGLEKALIAVQGHSGTPDVSDPQDSDSSNAASRMRPEGSSGVGKSQSPDGALQPMRYAQLNRTAAVAPLSELKHTQGLIEQLQTTLVYMNTSLLSSDIPPEMHTSRECDL